jgi:hypothetical protein
MTIWVDSGSPNTLVSVGFAERFGIPLIKGRTYSGNVAGIMFKGRHALTIPEIKIPNYGALRNVRAIPALDGEDYENILVLGLNVLNHCVQRLDRTGKIGVIELTESIISDIPNSYRTKFDHLIVSGAYLLTDGFTEDN